VPCGVGVLQGVVNYVAESVKVLRVGSVLDYRVGADEPPDASIVVPGIIEVKTAFVQPLPGEKPVRARIAGTKPATSKGEVLCPGYLAAGIVRDYGRAPEMVLMDVLQTWGMMDRSYVSPTSLTACVRNPCA